MIPSLIAPLANGLAVGILTAAVVALFAGFLVMSKLRSRHSPERILDARQERYTAEQALDSIERMGPHARRLYLLQETTLDMVFPAVYALWFAALIGMALAWLHGRGWPWLACLLPFAVAAFDYLENALVIVLLRRVARGERPLGVARTASFASAAKWRLGYACIAITAGLWLGALIDWMRQIRES